MTIRSSRLLEQGPGETGGMPVQLWILLEDDDRCILPVRFLFYRRFSRLVGPALVCQRQSMVAWRSTAICACDLARSGQARRL